MIDRLYTTYVNCMKATFSWNETHRLIYKIMKVRVENCFVTLSRGPFYISYKSKKPSEKTLTYQTQKALKKFYMEKDNISESEEIICKYTQHQGVNIH